MRAERRRARRMHVLHLMDGAGPQACPTTLALLGASLGRLGDVEQTVLLLGGAALRRAAEAASVGPFRCLGVPAGRAWLGGRALGRALRSLGRIDLIHCWSIGALAAAGLGRRSTPRLLTLTVAPPPTSLRWLRVLCGLPDRRTMLLPASGSIGATLVGGGIAEAAVHVLPPGLDLGLIDRGARSSLRQAWGIGSDRTRVVALLGDRPEAADAIAATMAVGLAAESLGTQAAELCLLVHPDQRRGQRARRIHAWLGRGPRQLTERRLDCPWRVLAACDLGLALGPEAGGLSTRWAMAAGLPIAAEASGQVAELLEDRHSALLATPGRPAALAHRLRQLVEDPRLAWRLQDTARREAFSAFARSTYRQSLKSVYEQVEARNASPVGISSAG